MDNMRFAIIGLYNSGSTALAGILHRLGANMGAPFWMNSDDGSQNNMYESYELSWTLRLWWNEPNLVEKATAEHRVVFLRRWMDLQECKGSAPVGAKHPLLVLSGEDIKEAWGNDTRFIWSYRSFDESVRGLVRRGWFPKRELSMQRVLWDALHEFERRTSSVVRMDWDDVRADPAGATMKLAGLTGLEPSRSQLTNAATFVRA